MEPRRGVGEHGFLIWVFLFHYLLNVIDWNWKELIRCPKEFRCGIREIRGAGSRKCNSMVPALSGIVLV
jgi:hypothetical protein